MPSAIIVDKVVYAEISIKEALLGGCSKPALATGRGGGEGGGAGGGRGGRQYAWRWQNIVGCDMPSKGLVLKHRSVDNSECSALP